MGKDSGKWKYNMNDKDWENLDAIAASVIRIYATKNILTNMLGITMTKDLWRKLGVLYQVKGFSNWVYLKEQFHTMRMKNGTKSFDHLRVLNDIVYELEAIWIKIDAEEETLWFIWTLPSFYEHMKIILIYRMEIVVFKKSQAIVKKESWVMIKVMFHIKT